MRQVFRGNHFIVSNVRRHWTLRPVSQRMLRTVLPKLTTVLAFTILNILPVGSLAFAQDVGPCDQLVATETEDRNRLADLGADCLASLPALSPVEQMRHIEWLVLKSPVYISAEDYLAVSPELAEEPGRKLNSYLMRDAANKRLMNIQEAQRLLDQAEQKNDAVSMAHLLFAFGVHTARTTGATDEMERYFRSSLKIAEESKLVDLLPAIYNALAVRAKRDGEADLAIALYDQAIAAYEELGRVDRTGTVLTNIGNIFVDLGGYEEAVRFHEASIENYELYRPHDTYSIARAYGNLASAYHADGQYAEAASAFERAKSFNAQAQSIVNAGRLNMGHAETLYALGQTEAAVEMAERAVPELLEAAHPTDSASALVWLADHYFSSNDLDKAQAKLEQARQIIEPEGADLRDFIERNHEAGRSLEYAASMGNFLMKIGETEEAAPYLSIALELSQDRFEQEKIEAAANSELLFDVRDRDASLVRLQDQAVMTELQLQRSRLTAGLGFLIAALIGLVAYSSFRSYRMQKTLAESRNVFLREVHHRTKNNFQIVSSLLSLSARRDQAQSGNAHVDHNDMASRVRAMAFVHDQLYKRDGDPSTKVDTEQFLSELLQSLSKSLGSDNIVLSQTIAPVRVDVDIATPLALVVCELVTNAYKHAFDDQGGKIHVTVSTMNKKIRVNVTDNGRGFEQQAARKKRGSLGMNLVEDLVSQIGGKLDVSSSKGGTSWTISGVETGILQR